MQMIMQTLQQKIKTNLLLVIQYFDDNRINDSAMLLKEISGFFIRSIFLTVSQKNKL